MIKKKIVRLYYEVMNQLKGIVFIKKITEKDQKELINILTEFKNKLDTIESKE